MRHLVLAALPMLAAPVLPQETPKDAAKPAPIAALVDAFPGQERFDRPIQIAWDARDADHRWVLEQYGRILRVPADGAKSERSVLLDLSERVLHPNNGGHNEEGLLGFAFDPDHADNAFVYLYYSIRTGGRGRDLKRASVISRFEVRDGIAGPLIDPHSELELMRIVQPWGNHNGGTIVFGPDRMLYVALGDGGAANDLGGNGQNKATLLGSILRIDVAGASAAVPYRVPADNPFVGEDGARGEIWAYGLRNPWRIAFDRQTGDLWCGDVGQNAFEEVDRIVRGGNYGWPIREALHEFPPGRDTKGDPDGLIDPIAEYPRAAGISITGGHVYRGTALPALTGRYVYGDYVFRTIWAVREDRGPQHAHDVATVGEAPAPIASFGEEPDGELLALCYDGRIYRLVPPAAGG